MVKPDAGRDYYAELGCSNSADPIEIKRAFKKLALKWHPDRNIGNEVEANSKFQEIQQAHEVLTDPEKRAKYDAERLKQSISGQKSSGGGLRPDPPPRTPRSPMNSDFPPPPRRSQATAFKAPNPSQNGNGPQAQQPMGANRYGPYAKFDRYQQDSFRGNRADAQSKSNAWDQMRKSGPTNDRSKPPPFGPPPRRNRQYADGKSGRQRGGWDSDTPPKPGPRPYAEKQPGVDPGLRRANTTAHQSPRGPGAFAAPGTGDEQPVPNASAYYNVSQGRRAQASRPQSWFPQPNQWIPNANPEQPPRPRVDPNVRTWKAQSAASDTVNTGRQSTPYATVGGEKTYFSNDHFQRSSSQSSNLHSQWNTGSTKTSPRSPASGSRNRHRSASPSFRSSYRGEEEDNLESSSSSGSSDDADEEPDDPPMPRRKLDPKGPSRRYRPNNADGRPHTDYPSVRVEGDPNSPHQQPMHRTTISDDTNVYDKSKAFFTHSQPGSRQPSPGDVPRSFAESRANNPNSQPPPSPLSSQQAPVNDEPSKPLEKSKSWQEKWGANGYGNKRYERPSTAGRTNGKPDFYLPTDSSSATTPLRDSSSEGVRPKFSSEDWHGKFENAADYLGPQNGVQATPRGRSTSKRPSAQDVFTKSINGEGGQPAESSASSTVEVPQATQAQEPSSAQTVKEDWAQHFQPPSTYGQSSPEKPKPVNLNRRNKTPRKMSTTKRPTTTPRPVKVTDVEDEAAQTISASSSNSAMDIDDHTHMPEMAARADPIANIIRNAVPPADSQPKPEPKVGDEEDDTLNLMNFKETAPFKPDKPGLNGLDELAATLPFESMRSSEIPGQTVSPLRLELPQVPKAPAAPDTDHMTSDLWKHYTVKFAKYLLQWNAYNTRMLSHFQARNQQEREIPDNIFLPSGNSAFSEYQSGIEEDFRVREHWEVSCEMHRDAVKQMSERRLVAARDGLNDD